jgi:hypothetical protein
MMSIPHCALWDIDRIIPVLIVRRVDIRDVWMRSLKTIVQVLEAERIVLPKPVFIADFHVTDLEWFWMTVFSAFGSPIRICGPGA